MVFHYIVALQNLKQDPYPGWKTPAGIACGPLGNSCAVEGSGNHGPGPQPLPGGVRAKFSGASRYHDGDHSLFDLRSARIAISGHSASHILPPAKRGYGRDAYNSTPNPLYKLSHVGHLNSRSNSDSNSQSTNSFYGHFSTPRSVDVTSIWGHSSHSGQFSSASLVSQNNGSAFNLTLHEGVVSMASVAVVSRFTNQSGKGSYSWDVNRTAAPQQHHDVAKPDLTPYWSRSDDSATKEGFLAPEPFTQYAATSPQGYSSI